MQLHIVLVCIIYSLCHTIRLAEKYFISYSHRVYTITVCIFLRLTLISSIVYPSFATLFKLMFIAHKIPMLYFYQRKVVKDKTNQIDVYTTIRHFFNRASLRQLVENCAGTEAA